MSDAGDRYLTNHVARRLLNVALGPGEYRLCRTSEASHACAAAAAGLAASGMEAVIRHVRDILDARVGEMQKEKVFVREVVERHTIFVQWVITRLSSLAGHLAAEYHRDCAIPGTGTVYEALGSAIRLLEERAIGVMEDFLGEPGPLAEDGVRRLLTERIPRVLGLVLEHPKMLPRAIEDAASLAHAVRADWEKDVRLISSDEACREEPAA